MDNGAMVAQAARFHLGNGEVGPEDLSADANLAFPGIIPRPREGYASPDFSGPSG